MAEAGDIAFGEIERRRQGDGGPAIERALGFRVEGPDRFDLVAEELDANGVGGVGGKHVEYPAAQAEFARDLDDLGPRHPAIEQPVRQLLDR